jgi:polysaccharide chain length determinant protein (PEP-CTERM system associated)
VRDGEFNSSAVEAVAGIWRRRWRLALAIFAVLVTGTYAFVRAMPNVYRSTARLLVDQSAFQASAPAEIETRLETISQEFLSRRRLEELILRFDLYPVMRKAGVSMPRVVERMSNDIVTESRVVENAASAQNTPVAVSVSYRGRDPQKIAAVTNTLASFYLEEDMNIAQRQAQGAARGLRAQLDEVKKKLDEQSRRVNDFQERHMGELPQQSEANLAELERLSSQLRMASEDRSKAMERREDLVRKLAEVAPVEGGGSPDVVGERLAKLHQELAELKRRFSDKYPDVIRVKGEIAALERQAAEAHPAPAAPAVESGSVRKMRDTLRDLDAQIRNLGAEEERLRREMASYHSRIENAPRRVQAYREVSRDYETTQDLYNSLLKKYEEARLNEASQNGPRGPQFRVLDYGVVPKEPVAPNRSRLLMMGFALAVAAAVAAAMIAEQVDTSFHSIDDVRAFTRVPVLASIPMIVTRADKRRGRLRFVAATASLLAALVVVSGLAGRLAHNETILAMLGR